MTADAATAGARPLRSVLSARRGLLVASAALFGGWQAAEALVPVFVGQVIDNAVAPSDTSALIGWLIALAVLFTLLSYGFRFGERLRARVAEHAGLDLRLALSGRILHPRGGASAGRAPGDLLSVATVDATRTAEITSVLSGVLIIASGVGVAAAFLLSASTLMGVIVLAGLPPVLLGLNLATRALERRSTAEQERAAAATALATDLVSGLRVVQGLGAERAATARYYEASRAALRARRRATRLLALQAGATLAVTSSFLALVALVGGRLAARGDITIGELVAAVGLAQYLIGPLTWIGFLLASLAQSRASARRVAAVLDAPAAIAPAPAPVGSSAAGPAAAETANTASRAAGALRLDGLRHGPVRSLDLDVPAGKLVALAVTDPAAAAAVLDCLAREVTPLGGAIRVDGADLASLDVDAARAVLLVAAHDADLFEDSVAANVTLSAAHPDRAAAALAAAGADGIAAAGADVPLTEWARSLSGGQRQRVALARALAADPPILVLHDPTTAVDAVTEARIAAGLRALRAGRTTVLVTTSPPLLAVVDDVVFLADGAVAARGSHAELAADCPAYRDAVLG